MANILEFTDLTGTAQLQKDNSTVKKFDAIRDEKEASFLAQILGAELADLFYANLTAQSPTTLDPRFQNIYDAFRYDYSCLVIESFGLKSIMMFNVWFYFARDNNIVIATGGNFAGKSENADQAADPANFAKNYNKCIKSAQAIQQYICENSTDYPEYNGQYLSLMSIF